MWEKRDVLRVLVGTPEGRRPPGREDGRIILKLILEKWGVVWTRLSWLRLGTGGELL
jgi:hypothetical protein